MRDKRARAKVRTLAGMTALAIAVVVMRPSTAAWDGAQDVALGDSITATFNVATPRAETHKYSFFAPKGTSITGAITPAKTAAGLVPELKLFTGLDVNVPFGAAQVGNAVKKFSFTNGGDYYFQVQSTAGTGSYTLLMKPTYPRSLAASETTGAYTFDACAGMVLTATVKPTKGSTATPNITGLTYQGGAVDITKTKKGKHPKAGAPVTKLAGLVLPVDGSYTLAIDPVTAGQSVDVKLGFSVPATRSWNFGFVEPVAGLPNENRAKWLTSGHADHTALPFNAWNTANPPVVPTSCARCHTTSGYRDYLGADGTAAGVVDAAAPIGQVITCDACHNDKADNLTSVTFPSGLTVSGLGNEARCMVCHQGRESTVSVEAAIAKATVTTKIATDETAGTGILGTAVAIPAGTTFTDTGAGFATAIGTIDNPSTFYLTFAALSTDLSANGGGTGVVTTKNIGRYQITAATADTLTLATPLVAEAAVAGKSYQYKVLQVKSDDTSISSLNFLNVHYFAAGASLYGRQAAGGYEYQDPAQPATGQTLDQFIPTLVQRNGYDIKFTHVASKDTCIQCHDPHSLEVRVDECANCHVTKTGAAVASKADLHDIRMAGSFNDYNGDGDTTQGLWYEIKGPNGLEAKLLAAIQDYATKVVGTSITYDGTTYPYYFVQGTSTKYNAWTPRLLKAAYNYQFSVKDPGSFAHNGKYVIELLYDSIADLNAKNAVTGFANLVRNDPGHFDSDEQAYRHWDAGGGVDASCARCHSIDGFKFVATYNVDPTVVKFPLISGLDCESCHVEGTSFAPQATNPNADKKPARVFVPSVTFPFQVQPTATTGAASTVLPSSPAQINAVTIFNGTQGTAAEDNSYICMTCHRARESKLTLDATIAADAALGANWTLSFRNSHYLGAGGSQYGSKAAVMYQYAGKVYAQRYDHDQAYNNAYPAATATKGKCEFCHMGSGLAGQVGLHNFKFYEDGANGTLPAGCTFCHSNATTSDQLTHPTAPQTYNFDNDPTTTPKQELAVFQARLLSAIQAYAKAATDLGTAGAQYVVYNGAAYPYFVKDTNKNGVYDVGEATSIKCDGKMFKATFNYNFSIKEPGCWAHNPKYVFQVLYDSIQDLGGDLTNLTRPN